MRRRWVSRLAWTLSSCAALISMLWLFAEESYWLDLLANLGAQVFIVLLLTLLVVLATRRWRAVLVASLACGMQCVPLAMHRAAWAPRGLGPNAPSGAVRFLHYNDSCLSQKRDVFALMERSGADVLSILCPPVQMQFEVFDGHGAADAYAGKLIRRWKPAPDSVSTEISAGFVVSRWPITRVDCAFVGPMADRFIAGVVERPGGRFGVIAVHPRSPRTPERWREGNWTIAALAALSRKMQADGLAVVVLADLNSTPTGWRSREACSAGGLDRAKPVFAFEGTYPDVVPLNIRTKQSTAIPAIWPASIAIDDALVSAGVGVVGWGTLPRLQSEHLPVVVDLRIPVEGTSAVNPSGR